MSMCGSCRCEAGEPTVDDEEVWQTGGHGRLDDDRREPKAGRTQAGEAAERNGAEQGNQTVTCMFSLLRVCTHLDYQHLFLENVFTSSFCFNVHRINWMRLGRL